MSVWKMATWRKDMVDEHEKDWNIVFSGTLIIWCIRVIYTNLSACNRIFFLKHIGTKNIHTQRNHRNSPNKNSPKHTYTEEKTEILNRTAGHLLQWAVRFQCLAEWPDGCCSLCLPVRTDCATLWVCVCVCVCVWVCDGSMRLWANYSL